MHEIRAGFVAAETAYERLRRLRAQRVAAALALETPAFTTEGPKLIFHALPVDAIAEGVWERILQMQENPDRSGAAIVRRHSGDVAFQFGWLCSSYLT